jgi:hypothetical protein
MRCFSWLMTNLSLLAILAAPALSADPVGTVQGGGHYGTTRGETPNKQPVIDTVTVNATMYADGTADGSMVWASTYNGFQEPGQGTSGWTWQMKVVGWEEWDGTLVLFGEITHSQLEYEVGGFVAIPFYDGGGDNADYIGFVEIKGNVRITGP